MKTTSINCKPIFKEYKSFILLLKCDSFYKKFSIHIYNPNKKKVFF